MTSDRTHRMWWWLLGRLQVLSVSLHVDIPNPPPTGGKIKPVLTSKMTGSRWVTPPGVGGSPYHYFKTPSLNHIFSELSNHIYLELSHCLLLYIKLYTSCGRFVEENWRSQILRRLIRGYMCVWLPTWLEREKVIRLSSLCLVRHFCLKRHKNCFLRVIHE